MTEFREKCQDHEYVAKPDPPNIFYKWHYRQAALAKTRGARELILEHDFPPGSDMIFRIFCQPKVAERIEFELFERLSAYK